MYNKGVAIADVTQWQSVRFPSRIRGFDSRHLLQRSRASPFGMRGFFCNRYRIRTLSAIWRKRMCGRTTCRLALLLPHISVLIPVICFFCNRYRIRTLSAFCFFCAKALTNPKSTVIKARGFSLRRALPLSAGVCLRGAVCCQIVPDTVSVAVPGVVTQTPSVPCAKVAAGTVIRPGTVANTPVVSL